MNIFKINRLESRDSFSTYTPFRTILIQVHEARNKLQKFSSSISEKKSYSPFIVDKITIHRDKIKYYSTKKETRNVQNYTAWTNKFKSRTKSLRSNDEKKIRIRLTPHLTWSILSRGPFTREKKTVIRGTWARRVDFDAISSSRKPRERERERGWRGKRRSAKGRGELDRRERIEIYSSSFCLEAVHTPLTCPFPDVCSNPLLSPGEISSIVYGGGK